MPQTQPVRRYRFGVFEADASTGELRRQGIRVRLKAQPLQLLLLLLERPGELITREEICRALWPDGTFVDYEHGVNSAINRVREALGDSASNPRFVETLARRGYRFVAPVQCDGLGEAPLATQAAPARDPAAPISGASAQTPTFGGILSSPEDLPRAPHQVVQTLFVLLQLMYLAFYIGALANLDEIHELMLPLPRWAHLYALLVATAVLLIPVRAFTASATVFYAPGFQRKVLQLWPLLLLADLLWAPSPLLLIHHMHVGLALGCAALLVYSPFAQRALVLMGAGTR